MRNILQQKMVLLLFCLFCNNVCKFVAKSNFYIYLYINIIQAKK